MQKYINIIYAVILIGLVVLVVRIQLFGQIDSVKESLHTQAVTMEDLQGDIETIANAINRQLQASQ